MAKTPKKRANAKGAAKKAAPTKAKSKNKKGLRAPVKGKQRIAAARTPFVPQSVGLTTLDLRDEPAHPTVEEQFEAEPRIASRRASSTVVWALLIVVGVVITAVVVAG